MSKITSSVFKDGVNNFDEIYTDGGNFGFNTKSDFSSGSSDFMKNALQNKQVSISNNSGGFGNFLSSNNIGGTLGTIGSIGSALASVYGMKQQQKFNKDMLNMEKDRVSKEYARRDKQQAEYDSVWKA